MLFRSHALIMIRWDQQIGRQSQSEYAGILELSWSLIRQFWVESTLFTLLLRSFSRGNRRRLRYDGPALARVDIVIPPISDPECDLEPW